MIVGLLHPGAMGAAIGAQLRRGGHEVRWCRVGRSTRSAERAHAAGLDGVDSLAALVTGCGVVVSVCPPAAAEDVAGAVADTGFTGVFVDANAISLHRVQRIGERFAANGADTAVVDGAIIGPPPSGEHAARVYLSGPESALDVVCGLFAGTPAEPVRLGGRLGQASALKIAYGSFQKISRVLAAVSHAMADEHGVTQHMLAEARALGPNALIDRGHLPSVAARAWRWGPEMVEDAESLAALGLPDELARAASAVFQRWDADKDDQSLDVDTALQHLRTGPHPE